MTIAFLIERSPYYRLLAPVIDAALARGWTVECWHDHTRTLDGLKSYQFPSLSSVPRFRNGELQIREYHTADELRSWRDSNRADAVVSITSAEAALKGTPAPSRTSWVGLQYVIDSIITHGPENLLANDLNAWYSPWWATWAIDYFDAAGRLGDRDTFAQQLRAGSINVGLPELDAVGLIDPDEVRRRWAIPRDRPVVVLFPFPQGVGKAGFWSRNICGEPSRLKQALRLAAHRRFEYWPHVRNGWNDRNVVHAIRCFCDRHGAYLVVKSRKKTPIPAYTEAVADLCLYDETDYPATILEILSTASLSFSYYSASVFESVALGVPHVCLTFTAEDYVGAHPEMLDYFSRFFTAAEGSPFQFTGVSTALTIPEALGALPARTLSDFAMDTAARRRYVEKFLSHDDRNSSRRTLDAIERVVAGRRR